LLAATELGGLQPGRRRTRTADIATQHPDYQSTPTRGGQHDRAVLLEFLADPTRMHALAEQLRASSITTASAVAMPEIDLGDESAAEGGLLERRHLARERDPKIKRRKIAAVFKGGGTISCEVCSFDFARTYGRRGHEYIECHPPSTAARLRASHHPRRRSGVVVFKLPPHDPRGRPWLTVEELSNLVKHHQ